MTTISRRFQARRLQALLAASIALLALALLPAAASAERPYDIAILKADGGNTPAELEGALQVQPSVSNVVVFDVGLLTPLQSQIADYDIVLVYSNTNYENAAVLGDRLADYVDAGGVVIPLTFDGTTAPNRSLGGRWVADEYRPWLPGATVDSTPRTLGSHDATHPLMQGVAALSAMYRISDLAVAPGATQVAAWSGGAPLVSVKGRVVGINAMLGTDDEWGGDFVRLILNAADWLYPQPAPPVVPAAQDTAKPTIAGLALKPKAFKAAVRGAKKSGGTKVAFRLSEPAVVRLTVQRRTRGRKVGRKCVAPRPRNRGAKSCVRWLKVKGSISHVGTVGPNSLRFTGRLRGRKLAPGRYRIGLVATDAAGNESSVHRRAFRIR